MDLWVSFWSALTGFVSEYGLLAIALIVLLRSAAVPIPIPADILVVAVGAQARQQGADLWPAWLLLSAATVVGAQLFYVFVRWIGEGGAAHYGRYLGLSEERLTTAETRLEARGTRGVIVARIVPGLRLPIVAVCGIVRFQWWKVLAAVTVGALTYVGMLIAFGYLYGQGLVDGIDALVFPLGVIEPLVGLGVLLFWLVRGRYSMAPASAEAGFRRSSRVRVGVLSGTLATVGSNWLVNMLIYVVAPVATPLALRGRTPDSTMQLFGGLDSLVEGYVGDLVLGLALGVAYTVADGVLAKGWDDWLRGLAFGALAWLLVVVVHVVVGFARDGSLTALPITSVVEAIRWATYGVFVGLIYPVLRGPRLQATAQSYDGYSASIAPPGVL